MYSLKPFPQNLRVEFVLPYDPYYVGTGQKGEDAEKAVAALKHLGVFFYRDDENSRGLLMRPTGSGVPENLQDGTTFVPEEPLKVYNFNLVATYPIIRPQYFAKPQDRSEMPKYNQLITKYGDAVKWLRWNDERLLRQVNTTLVSLYS